MNDLTLKNILFILLYLLIGAMLGGAIGYAIALNTGLDLIITTAAVAALGIIMACCVRQEIRQETLAAQKDPVTGTPPQDQTKTEENPEGTKGNSNTATLTENEQKLLTVPNTQSPILAESLLHPAADAKTADKQELKTTSSSIAPTSTQADSPLAAPVMITGADTDDTKSATEKDEAKQKEQTDAANTAKKN